MQRRDLRSLKDSEKQELKKSAIRMIKQGGVKIDGEKLDDTKHTPEKGTSVYQVGKRKFARITLA